MKYAGKMQLVNKSCLVTCNDAHVTSRSNIRKVVVVVSD